MRTIYSFLLFGIITLISCANDEDFLVAKEKITKISLSDNENTVIIEQKNNTWVIDGYIPSNSSMVNNLLEIASRLKTEYPVPLSQERSYTPDLFDKIGLNVQIYNKDKLLSNYSLLFEEGKAIGCIQGKQQAYYVYLPGEEIILSDYLSSDPLFWQDNLLFNARVPEILSVKIVNIKKPEQSFRIDQSLQNGIQLEGINRPIDFEIDSIKLRQYLSYFTLLHFDHFASNQEKNKMLNDTLFQVMLKSNTQNIAFSIILMDEDKMGANGEPLYYNRDYFFLKKEEDEMMIGEWVNFDILLKELDDFKK